METLHHLTLASQGFTGASGALGLSSTPRVLVVEDDLTYEPIWESILRKVMSRVDLRWATDVEEAEIYIRSADEEGRPFDLVISDVFLSGYQTGIDLWQKQREVLNHKMILVSGLQPSKLIKRVGPGSPIPVYLKKPLRISESVETVYWMLFGPRSRFS